MKTLWLILALILAYSLLKVQTRQNYLQGLEGKRLALAGRVGSEPIFYENAQSLKIHGISINLPRYPEVSYGDRVTIEGVYSQGKLNDAAIIAHTPTNGLIFKLRNRLISFYKQALPEPHASLVAGIVMGSKKDIPNSFWQDLKKTGTLHVVVASGMNVTLVAGFLMEALVQVMNRRRAVIIAVCGIWLYALLSGFEAPIVRASIMGSIVFSAQKLGRVYDAWRGLMLSVILMLLFKPLYISDLGFQLSVLATASLIKFGVVFNRLLYFVPGIFREGLATSLAAQVGVAPLLFITFGDLNPFSPFINALVLWTIPYITILGMLAGILALMATGPAGLVLSLVYPLTFVFVKVVIGASF